MIFFSLFLEIHENKNMFSGHLSVYFCLYGRFAHFVKLVNEVKIILVIDILSLRQIDIMSPLL